MCTPVTGAGTSGRPPSSTSQEESVGLALVSGAFLDEGAGWVMALCRGPWQSVCGPHAGARAKHLYGFPDGCTHTRDEAALFSVAAHMTSQLLSPGAPKERANAVGMQKSRRARSLPPDNIKSMSFKVCWN